MTAAVVVHNAVAVRMDRGTRHRWYAQCNVCSFLEPGGSKEGADTAAANHNHTSNLPVVDLSEIAAFVQRMRCDCYVPDLMEYAPEPCDRCRLVAMVEGAMT